MVGWGPLPVQREQQQSRWNWREQELNRHWRTSDDRQKGAEMPKVGRPKGQRRRVGNKEGAGSRRQRKEGLRSKNFLVVFTDEQRGP